MLKRVSLHGGRNLLLSILFLFALVPSAWAQPTGFPETFEISTKDEYTPGPVGFASGTWQFDDALLGRSELDRRNDDQAVRLRRKGKITMDFFVPAGAGTVKVKHGIYGLDASSAWELWVMSEACGCNKWTKVGQTVISATGALQEVSFTVGIPGNIRFEIRKVTGGEARLNIDDFTFTSYGSTSGPHYPDNDHLALGNPSNATEDVNTPTNYLMRKPQYALSYHRDRAIPNWVSWHLDAFDRGEAKRVDDFREDPSLPAGWYRVHENSYKNTGFDRGHNIPSADRTSTQENNSATFFMTNIIPQAPLHNQSAFWAKFEDFTRTFLPNHELYIIMGNYGVGGRGANGGITNTMDNGRVTVPSRIWKVIVILPVGDKDITRIGSGTRVIAVDTPNDNAVGSNWGAYRTSIDAIEAATGLNLLSSLPVEVQTLVEAKVDNGPTN